MSKIYKLFIALIIFTQIQAYKKQNIAIVRFYDENIGKYSDWNKLVYAQKHGYNGAYRPRAYCVWEK